MPAKSLLAAASKSKTYLQQLQSTRAFYRIADRDVTPGEIEATVDELIRVMSTSTSTQDLNAHMRESFDLYESVGSDNNGKVVFSCYYQPLLPASFKKTAKFKYPLYRKPRDMVMADPSLFGHSGDTLVGRVTKDGKLVPYFSRRDIDVRSALAGRGLEIAWLSDGFDRLALHIEGSGILRFPDGELRFAKVSTTNALPYRSVGAAIVGAGIMSKSDISYQRLQQYIQEHPEGEAWILSQNPRYTFFNLEPLSEEGEPYGSMSQTLTPGRSIATDPKIIPMCSIMYFITEMPQADSEGRLLGIFPTSRFAMSQDTGGAIQGPGRVDIYVGHGAQAKTMATNQWSEGKLYLLLKKLPARTR
jgi:membrane-bound lytic murein transglycosylase A